MMRSGPSFAVTSFETRADGLPSWPSVPRLYHENKTVPKGPSSTEVLRSHDCVRWAPL